MPHPSTTTSGTLTNGEKTIGGKKSSTPRRMQGQFRIAHPVILFAEASPA
jgi:hypothetical protein